MPARPSAGPSDGAIPRGHKPRLIARAACVLGVSLHRPPRIARRHRRHLAWVRYLFRSPPFLRFSELKLVPCPPSPPSPQQIYRPRLARSLRTTAGLVSSFNATLPNHLADALGDSVRRRDNATVASLSARFRRPIKRNAQLTPFLTKFRSSVEARSMSGKRRMN